VQYFADGALILINRWYAVPDKLLHCARHPDADPGTMACSKAQRRER
jgi:hypothetical protein